MRFWDPSALVPLVIEEPVTPTILSLLVEDDQVVCFWSAELECTSAIVRRDREGLEPQRVSAALEQLARLRSRWSEARPGDAVRDRARRLLRVHPLRTLESLQLAAALVVCEESPASLPFVCLDRQLRTAAGKEGFPLLPAEPW